MTRTKIADPLKPMSPEFLLNPYPTYARLREEAPVLWSETGKYWIVTRYEDIHSIMRDLSYEKGMERWRQFNPLAKLVPDVKQLIESRSHWMLNMDPPDHTRLRSLVNKAFTPKMVEQLKPHIQEIADNLIDQLKDKNEFDLVSEFAFPFPVTVIAEMLGVPASDRDKFRHWSTIMTETFEPGFDMKHMKPANQANVELIEYLKPLVEERRRNPQHDLISALVAAEEEGSKLSEAELLANCVLILVAGHETTVNLIGNAVYTLLKNPEQLALLKSQPDLIASAISEVLRYESPVQMVRRLAHDKMELGGETIAERDMVVLMLGSANRDPSVFENPDQFLIQRDNSRKHMAFGHGIHHCLGSSLAEAEGQIAISTLFDRLPNLKLKEVPVEIRVPFALRGPKALHVLAG